MKKYILKSLFVSVLCMLAASCQDTEFVETLDSSKAQVMFSVAMDSPAARSRATWGDDYTPSDLGDEYDNRIDLDQFIVKIEAGGKTYNVTDIIKWKEGESNEYKFVGIVKNQNGENVGKVNLSKAKISVYANMGNDANANFATMTFNQDAENIPMWGALTVENLEFAPGKRTNVDDIYLLRAMAKFQVTLGEDAIEKGYTLTKASLNKFNLVGNNMPTGYADATSTMTLGLEDVMNENTSKLAGATELTEATEDGNGWVIYLPEISNTTASELKMLLTFSKGDNEQIETEVSVKDYSTANTGLVNIVRNHWYKYVIEDIVNAKPVVKYETLDWEPINIEVGGEGYLYLNKDVIEIFNANVDANQLTFSSSSPIASIVLKDVYEHTTYLDKFDTYLDGTNDEDKDQTYAYYIDKFGNKMQLGTDPEHPETQEAEQTILSKIRADYTKDALNGGITIYSPFVADPTNDTQALQHDSHYNAIRYLEFEVTNEQGSTADFRVMQYPSVVITNEEGFFSYRDDFCVGHHELGTNQPPVHWLNFQNEAYILAAYNNTHIHQVDPLLKDDYGNDYYSINNEAAPQKEKYFKELILADWNRWYKSTVYPYGEFERKQYGTRFGSGKNQLLLVGPPYRDENYDGKYTGPYDVPSYLEAVKGTDRDGWWRKHYTGNVIEFFMSKVIKKVYRDGVDNNGYNKKRLPGQADIFYHIPNNSNNGWSFLTKLDRVNTLNFNNNKMYHIETKQVTDRYTIGYPEFVSNDSVLIENRTNANLVSPSFMVASQLGMTETPIEDNPDVYLTAPIEYIYEVAKNHCKQYVETKFEDKDGDGEWDNDEKVTYYRNWRLPTKAEINLLIEYQKTSRAMDIVLTGERYMCVTGDKEQPYSDVVDGFTNSGYFMRCVRDVKPEENINN